VLVILHTCHDTNTTQPTAQMRCIHGDCASAVPSSQPACLALRLVQIAAVCSTTKGGCNTHVAGEQHQAVLVTQQACKGAHLNTAAAAEGCCASAASYTAGWSDKGPGHLTGHPTPASCHDGKEPKGGTAAGYGCRQVTARQRALLATNMSLFTIHSKALDRTRWQLLRAAGCSQGGTTARTWAHPHKN
jgi:hypothetical protein